jgi:hypothetical protein
MTSNEAGNGKRNCTSNILRIKNLSLVQKIVYELHMQIQRNFRVIYGHLQYK